MNTKELYAIEYSLSQQQFHVDILEDVIKNNCITINERCATDYLIIGICESRAEAREFIDKYQEHFCLPCKHSLLLKEGDKYQ